MAGWFAWGRRRHYFADRDDGTSLCRRHRNVVWPPDVQNDVEDYEPGNCAECYRRKSTRDAKGETP